MRMITAVTAAVMIASTASASGHRYFSDSATYACVGATKSAESYIPALASRNRGVVESALAHVAMIKLTMPQCDLSSAKASVTAIESRGATAELRYKAWVVRMLMENPDLFASLPKAGYAGPDELFGTLASRMAECHAAR